MELWSATAVMGAISRLGRIGRLAKIKVSTKVNHPAAISSRKVATKGTWMKYAKMLRVNLNRPTGFPVAKVKKPILTIPVQNTTEKAFIRIHLDESMMLQAKLLDLNEEWETFLVNRGLWSDLLGEIVDNVLFLIINRQRVHEVCSSDFAHGDMTTAAPAGAKTLWAGPPKCRAPPTKIPSAQSGPA
jgi:hypothetical protein